MSLYIDAEEEHIETWYIERFLLLQRTAFQQSHSFFRHYRDLPPAEAKEVARGIWREINQVNLRENILPTRERAHIVLRKTADHSVEQVRLRQI
jgi:type I pantothenate kinase